MENNKIICLLGGGGSGKDTIRMNLIKKHSEQITEVISYTTRPMRCTETGSEYKFIDKATFSSMYENGEFAEIREYEVISDKPGETETWYYGYTTEDLDLALKQGNILLIIDLDGYKEIKGIYGDKCIGYFIDVSRDERLRRYLNREEITWKVVSEAVRRIEDDDTRAFIGYQEWVDFTVSGECSSVVYDQIEKSLLEQNILHN